jgi:hypothetical protein
MINYRTGEIVKKMFLFVYDDRIKTEEGNFKACDDFSCRDAEFYTAQEALAWAKNQEWGDKIKTIYELQPKQIANSEWLS